MDSLPQLSQPLPDANAPSTVVVWLGYGGLLPFVLLTLGVLLDPAHGTLWRDSQLAYGAVILSFVGALHWAFAMTLPELDAGQRAVRFVWSVIPALLAWTALLLPPLLAATLLIAGFVVHYLQDRRLDSISNLANWYLPMRLRLSSVACICLAASGYLGTR
jgi:hypothetical protein